MQAHHRTPARILALIALVGAAIALLVIISSASNGSDTSTSSTDRSAEKARDLGSSDGDGKARRRKRDEDKLPKDVYVVKSGDTLGGIAEKTGVPVERLQELNPGLDQFQLVAGQRIKLR